MTLSEFKAWFSGYTEDMDKPPSAKQWKRIKAVVKDVDGTGITERIYLDRYWTSPWREKWGYVTTGDPLPSWPTVTITNNTMDAMFAAGKAEYDLEHTA